MKRSGWAPGNAPSHTTRKKGRARTINQILKASYRLYAKDWATKKSVKACLG